jgi:hypothetical protein
MILSTHGIVSSISGIDADWLAYYNRVIAAGGSLSTTEQNATKTLVADLKAAGIWSNMQAIYPMVGASAAACAQNLKSSSFTGTFNGGWTFSSTGVTPNGTNAYINTNIISQTDLFGKNSSIAYYSRTNNAGLFADIGNFGTTGLDSFSFYTNLSNEFYLDYPIESERTRVANTNSTGFYIANNSSSIGKTLFRNGTKIINGAFANFDFPLPIINKKISISASYLAGTPRYSSRQIAYAHFASALTDGNCANLQTAVQAFQTTLSRQV